MKQRGSNAELCEGLVTMAEKGRAVRAALSSEDPMFLYHPMTVELCQSHRSYAWAALLCLLSPSVRHGQECDSWVMAMARPRVGPTPNGGNVLDNNMSGRKRLGRMQLE